MIIVLTDCATLRCGVATGTIKQNVARSKDRGRHYSYLERQAYEQTFHHFVYHNLPITNDTIDSATIATIKPTMAYRIVFLALAVF